MGTIFAHLAIGLLYFMFPDYLSLLPLLLGAILPDIDYLFLIGKDLITGSKKEKLTANAFRTGFFHSILGVYVVLFPFSVLILNLFGVISAFSVFLGLTLHLLIDLPAHSKLMLFYPEIIDNPFLINLKWSIPD